MPTMTDTETVWLLRLNDMRAAQIEILGTVAVASSREALVAFLDAEAVEPYRDGQWNKSYRAGGPLEWCNPPFDDERSFVCIGTRAEAMASAAQNFDRYSASAPRVG